jgi:hypothetical protein
VCARRIEHALVAIAGDQCIGAQHECRHYC